RERAVGVDVADRAAKVAQALSAEGRRLDELREAWAREKKLVDEILSLRARLRAATGKADVGGTVATANSSGTESPAADPMSETEQREAQQRLRELQSELSSVQGDSPLMLPSVDEQ